MKRKMIVLLATQTVLFGSDTWNGNGSDWNSPGNWNPGGFPNAQDAVAVFEDTGLAEPTVYLSASVTVGNIDFDQSLPSPSYTITKTPTTTETITFDATVPSAKINMTSSTLDPHTISVPLVLTSPLTIDISPTLPAFPPALTISDDISGGGSLTLAGLPMSVLTLSGTCSHTGATTVNQGVLVVDGTITVSPLTMNAGTFLTGVGTLADVTVQPLAAVAPGNPVGTQTYSNLTFTPGSFFLVEIDPLNASKALVTNTALLGNATVHLAVGPGTYSPDTRYTILTAGTPLTDTFLSLDVLTPGFAFQLTYDANNVYLSQLLLSAFSFSGSDATVANYLNQNSNLLGSSFADLVKLPLGEQQQGVNTINPISLNNATASTVSMTTLIAQTVNSSGNGSGADRSGAGCISFRHFDIPDDDRILAMNKLGAADEFSVPIKSGVLPKAPQKPSNIWILAFGDFAYQDRQEQTPAFNSTSGGTFIGYDWGKYSRGLIGCGAGYSYSHIHQHQNRGSANSNAAYAMVYGKLFAQNFFFDTSLLASFVNTSASRHIFYPGFDRYAKSSQNAWILDPHVRFGYDWIVGNKKNWVLEPYGALDWINVFAASFQEKHGGVYNMKISSHYGTLLQSEAGLNLYWTYKYIGGFVSVKCGASYINKAPFALGKIQAALVGATSSFTVESFTAVRNLGSPSFELFWQNRCGTYLSVSYQGQFGSGYINNAGLAKLGKNF